MLFVVRCSLFVVRCVLFAVCCLSYVVCWLLAACCFVCDVCCMLSVGGCLLFSCLLHDVCLLFGVRFVGVGCVPVVVCRLSLAVC